MTEEDSLLLNNLKANTQQLFQQFNHLEKEIGLLEDRMISLKMEIERLEKEKLEMSQKNEQMKIATVLLSGVDENRVAKQKINKLVREIDKCIALLNR